MQEFSLREVTDTELHSASDTSVPSTSDPIHRQEADPSLGRRSIVHRTWGTHPAGFLLLLTLCLLGTGCRSLERYDYTEAHMGTTFRIILFAADEQSAQQAAQQAFAAVAECERVASDYRADSELNELHRASPHGTVTVSAELFELLVQSEQVSQATDGAFDVTVGPLVRLWRRAQRQRALPAQARIDAARAAVGYEKLRLERDPCRVTFEAPNMRIDLGGVAKGAAAQHALDILAAAGIERALVDGGGDIALGAPPPNQTGWKIALPQPDQGPPIYVQLSNCAIATSGPSAKSVAIAGEVYSHILDPSRGGGSTIARWVTVVAADGGTADALASALHNTPDLATARAWLEPFEGASALLRGPGSTGANTHTCGAFPLIQLGELADGPGAF